MSITAKSPEAKQRWDERQRWREMMLPPEPKPEADGDKPPPEPPPSKPFEAEGAVVGYAIAVTRRNTVLQPVIGEERVHERSCRAGDPTRSERRHRHCEVLLRDA